LFSTEEQKNQSKGERLPVNIGVDHRPSRTLLRQMIPAETNKEELERNARNRKCEPIF